MHVILSFYYGFLIHKQDDRRVAFLLAQDRIETGLAEGDGRNQKKLKKKGLTTEMIMVMIIIINLEGVMDHVEVGKLLIDNGPTLAVVLMIIWFLGLLKMLPGLLAQMRGRNRVVPRHHGRSVIE